MLEFFCWLILFPAVIAALFTFTLCANYKETNNFAPVPGGRIFAYFSLSFLAGFLLPFAVDYGERAYPLLLLGTLISACVFGGSLASARSKAREEKQKEEADQRRRQRLPQFQHATEEYFRIFSKYPEQLIPEGKFTPHLKILKKYSYLQKNFSRLAYEAPEQGDAFLLEVFGELTHSHELTPAHALGHLKQAEEELNTLARKAILETPNPVLLFGETLPFQPSEKDHALEALQFPEHRYRHTYLLGKTGSGKTTLLKNLIAQDLRRNVGVIVLSAESDLFTASLNSSPKSGKKTSFTLIRRTKPTLS
jgi:hypothetical protein